MTVEHSIRKIIGAEPIHKVGHIPKVELAREEVIQNGKLQEGEKVVGLNVTFYYESDYKRFIKLLDYEKCSYISKVYGKTITLEHKKHNIPSRVINTKVHKVFMSIEQTNKFIKGTLQIEIDSVEQLGNTAAIKTA
ncbi:MAG: hypothetical protein LBV62_02125 [Rickettsiales bacterium]|jgi:hypothetical protein|nr:hypothetical protein [Rickettsiales bacterium]